MQGWGLRWGPQPCISLELTHFSLWVTSKVEKTAPTPRGPVKRPQGCADLTTTEIQSKDLPAQFKWDPRPWDPLIAGLLRNLSVSRGEISTYWEHVEIQVRGHLLGASITQPYSQHFSFFSRNRCKLVSRWKNQRNEATNEATEDRHSKMPCSVTSNESGKGLNLKKKKKRQKK